MPELAEAPVFDVDQLRNICLDDNELMRELVSSLLEDVTAQMPGLRQAVDQADAAQCARLAHYVKGASANIGAASLAALMKSIECSARVNDFAACRASIELMPAELQKFSSVASSL